MLGMKVPDYYPTMYLDGYTPEQIMMAVHQKMRNESQEARLNREAEE